MTKSERTEYEALVARQLAEQRSAASPSVIADLDRSLGNRSEGAQRQNTLRSLIESANRGAPGLTKAGSHGELRMSDLLPPAPADAVRSFSVRDLLRPAGEATIGAAILAESLVAQAGAKLIFMPPPKPVGQEGAFYTRPGRYLTVTPAGFVSVTDGADVVAGALPFLASADFATEYGEASAACRFEISRADQRNMSQDELQFIISKSLIRGLAKLADKTLLDAIVATTPGAWSLDAAAAHGLNFGELRAIAGSLAKGAAVGVDGVLRAGGLPAELTDAITTTVAGAFNRAAVGTEESFSVLIERRSLAGDLVVTVFASMTPAISDAEAFFVIGA